MIDVKIESDKCNAKESKYPYIGISNDGEHIVLFIKEDTGSCLSSCNTKFPYPIGDYDTCWIEENFTQFKGKITLSNK